MFYDRFMFLCNKKGVKGSRVAVDTGFNKGSVTSWKNKWIAGIDVHPTPDILSKIAGYFNCSIDYLLGLEDFSESSNGGSNEQILIYFNNLNDFGKKKALDFLADLNDVPKYLNADTSKNKKVAARKGGLEERPLADDEQKIINDDCQVPEES